MKNLTKIFMAVAVAMFAFSCVNDTTEDIAVKVGGKTTLAISLGGGNRTALGEAENGVYPITWAEGDQITVNGETSEPLAAADADTANAVFTFNDELAAPYCVAYPAAEANQVVFAAEQEYVEGTFANGAATMYGYSNGGRVKLNHLTGVLKIGVVCDENVDIFDAPVIQSVKISTIDRAPIAGAFNINFKTGAVTPTAEATSVINYFIDEKLSQSPTYLHIAVPAGVYNELYVTLEDSDGGVMYATVTADDKKPLAAGKVREFSSDIVYEATTTTDKYIIKDYSSLLAFKNAIEAAQTTSADDNASADDKAAAAAVLVKDAIFAGDVDLNGVNWGSIDATDYKGTIYGNGFAIKNLDAPLFNETRASFKGLHLNVNITETGTLYTGTFARKSLRTATDKNAVFENCSASGTLTIDNQTYTTTSSNRDVANTGAFVGRAYGVDFKNCTNRVNINLKKVQKAEGQSTTLYFSAGGFVGYTNSIVNFDNCTNYGNITWAEVSEGRIIFYLAGLIGLYRNSESQGAINNCCNKGNFDIKASTRGGQLGGLVAYANGASDATKTITFTGNTTNTGNITLAGTQSNNQINIGGIFGYLVDSTTAVFDGDVVNSGIFTFKSKHTDFIAVGGIIGHIYNKSIVTFNKPVTNNGEINFVGTTEASTEAFRLGGIVGEMSIEGNKVYFNDTTINNADISVTAPISTNLYCGGIVGRSHRKDNTNTASYTTPYIYFQGKTITNNGDIYIKTNPTEATFVGGITGYSYLTAGKFGNGCRVTNNGLLTIDNSTLAGLYLGGVWGYLNGGSLTVVNATTSKGQIVNKKDVTFTGEVTDNCYVGGLIGYSNNSATIYGINTGNVTVTAKFDAEKTVRVSGAVARHNNGKTFDNFQIYCNVVAYGITKDNDNNYTFTPYTSASMFSGMAELGTFTNSKIGGKIATNATVVNGKVEPTWTTIDSTNYFDYILGTRQGLTTFAGFSLLSSVNDIDWSGFGE